MRDAARTTLVSLHSAYAVRGTHYARSHVIPSCVFFSSATLSASRGGISSPRRCPVCARERLDFVIANAENSAGGSGLTPANYREIIATGVDCITLGDHIYRRKEIEKILSSEKNIVKPANYPAQAPGLNWTVLPAADGTPVAVFSLQGRVFMKPVDCPFKAADRVLAEIPPM